MSDVCHPGIAVYHAAYYDYISADEIKSRYLVGAATKSGVAPWFEARIALCWIQPRLQREADEHGQSLDTIGGRLVRV